MNLSPYQGGRRLLGMTGVAGAIGLALTAVGGLVSDPRRVLYAYLVAFVYWLGLVSLYLFADALNPLRFR